MSGTGTPKRGSRAFTLIELIVVVVVLGILAAVVVPRFTNATNDAVKSASVTELMKIRRALDVYIARNAGSPPTVTTGYATWGELVGSDGYLRSSPMNRYVPKPNQGRIYAATDAAADTAYQTNYAWVFNTVSGEIWAGGFDAQDNPLPMP